VPREGRYPAVFRGRPGRLLQITATRFALLLDEQLPPGHALPVVAHHPAWGASLVTIPATVPRAYVPGRVLSSGSQDETERALQRPDFAAWRDAVIEGAQPQTAEGRCAITSDRPERVVMRCVAATGAWAVLTDVVFPGWHASVDGHEAEIHHANLALRAVRIPAGTSRVELRYRPRRLVAGAWVSLGALAACAAVLAWSRRRSPAA